MTNLNKKQIEVIQEIQKNILLLASAGTGKTDILSKRILSILDSGTATAEEILCITFTNKACQEMKGRLSNVLKGEASKVTIRTFHSFCFDIVKLQAKKRTDIFTDFIIYDDEDCKEVISSCNYNKYPVNMLKSFIDEVKKERTSLNIFSSDTNKDVEQAVFNVCRDERIDKVCTNKGSLDRNTKNYLISKGKDLVIAYNSVLNSNHALDFNDLIMNAKDIFNDEAVVNSIAKKYKYINIDEVQDTSIVEYLIIEKLFKNSNILLCGDKFQTIYEWRGSNPDRIFEHYIKNYSPNIIAFDKNYRATKNLTNASLEFLNNAFPRQVQETYKDGIISASTEAGNKIKLAKRDNIDQEALFIISEINKLMGSGEDISKSCILTRDNTYNARLSTALSKYSSTGYEFALVDEYKFFRRQEIKDLVAFLKLIANPNDSFSLKRIIERLPNGIGKITLTDIDSNDYKSIGIRLSDFIDKDVCTHGEKYSLLLNEVENNNIIVFDVESTGINVTEDEIIQIAAIRIDSNGNEIERFMRFLKNVKPVGTSEYVHGFSDDFLKNNGEDKETVLREFLDFSKDAVIVGHNVQYDTDILTSELSRLGLPLPSFKGVYDTLDIYRRFYPNAQNHKLETLSRIFDTKNKPDHNALNDILATGELLVYAVETFIKPTSLERIGKMNKYLGVFTSIREALNNLIIDSKVMRPYEIITYIMMQLKLREIYSNHHGEAKIERVRDFYLLVKELDDTSKSPKDSLLDTIKMTGLSNGEMEELLIKKTNRVRIPIITVHQSKGLQYDNVFLAGLQEDTFPSYGAVKSGDLREDMRAFYVAITRAKKNLYMVCNTRGLYNYPKEISRFIDLIPSKYVDVV